MKVISAAQPVDNRSACGQLGGQEAFAVVPDDDEEDDAALDDDEDAEEEDEVDDDLSVEDEVDDELSLPDFASAPADAFCLPLLSDRLSLR